MRAEDPIPSESRPQAAGTNPTPLAISIGTDSSSGPKLFCVSGLVKRPGCYEGPMTITCEELIYGDDYGQGMVDDVPVKAVFPGGLSMGVLTAVMVFAINTMLLKALFG